MMLQIIDLTDKKFDLGHIVMTRGVQALFAEKEGEMYDYLQRHMHGDWGDLGEEDKRSNDQALIDNTRLLSSYKLPPEHGGGKLWIITEWDRSATTFLLPSEY